MNVPPDRAAQTNQIIMIVQFCTCLSTREDAVLHIVQNGQRALRTWTPTPPLRYSTSTFVCAAGPIEQQHSRLLPPHFPTVRTSERGRLRAHAVAQRRRLACVDQRVLEPAALRAPRAAAATAAATSSRCRATLHF